MSLVLISKEGMHPEEVTPLVVQVNEMGLCLKFLEVGSQRDALLNKGPDITIL
jgi:hypothetical protein